MAGKKGQKELVVNGASDVVPETVLSAVVSSSATVIPSAVGDDSFIDLEARGVYFTER